jgi:hypothetical protein
MFRKGGATQASAKAPSQKESPDVSHPPANMAIHGRPRSSDRKGFFRQDDFAALRADFANFRKLAKGKPRNLAGGL